MLVCDAILVTLRRTGGQLAPVIPVKTGIHVGWPTAYETRHGAHMLDSRCHGNDDALDRAAKAVAYSGSSVK
jgi:hypothetical protein